MTITPFTQNSGRPRTGTDADTSATTALNVNASTILNPVTIIGNAGTNYVTGTSVTDQLDGRNGSDETFAKSLFFRDIGVNAKFEFDLLCLFGNF